MTLTPTYTRQFECDTKRMQKRGKNLEKLKIIIRSIVAKEPLDAIHRDHKLIGNWKGRRECYIESDWLLICMVDYDRVVLERTGTHSDLFQTSPYSQKSALFFGHFTYGKGFSPTSTTNCLPIAELLTWR